MGGGVFIVTMSELSSPFLFVSGFLPAQAAAANANAISNKTENILLTVILTKILPRKACSFFSLVDYTTEVFSLQ